MQDSKQISQKEIHQVFQRVCSNLGLKEDIRYEAWRLYNEIWVNRLSLPQKSDDNHLNIACALFISNFNKFKSLRPETALGGLKIVQLLQETRVGMVNFFEHLSNIAGPLQQGDDFRTHFQALKHNFVLTSVIFKKYQKLWSARKQLLVSCGLQGEGPEPLSGAFELGWYLYLLAKARLGMGFLFPNSAGQVEADIRTCMHLLIATVALLLEEPLKEHQMHLKKDPWPSKVLEILCQENCLDHKTLVRAWEAVKGFITDLIQRGILGHQGRLKDSGKAYTNISGVTDQAVCRQNLLSIGSEYDRCTHSLAIQSQPLKSPGEGPKEALFYLLDERFVVSNGVRVLMPALIVGEDGIGVEPALLPVTSKVLATLPNPTIVKTETEAPVPVSSSLNRARPPLPHPTSQVGPDDPFTSPTLNVLDNLSPIPRSQTDLFQDLSSGRTTGPSFYSPLETPSSLNQTAPPSNSTLGSVFNTPDPALLGSQEDEDSSHETKPLVNDTVTSQMETVTWIQNIEQLPNKPSKDLEEFFNICKRSPAKRINDRCNAMLQKITLDAGGLPTGDSIESNIGCVSEEDNGKSKGNSTQKDRGISITMEIGNNPRRARECMITRSRRLGQALYLSVLEAMLKRESARLKTRDHSLLLHNESFHKALLTCSVEVVLKANSLVTLAYPRLLGLFDVQAFDVYKVLESFVRFCTNLPASLKRHLQTLEDQILEKRAWVDDSSLFRLLEEQRLAGPWPLEALGRAWELQNPDLPTTVGTLRKELSDSRQAKHRPPPDRARTRSLEFFFRKLMVLVANRIYELCVRKLRLSIDIRNQVWTTVKYCLGEHNSMLRNRHLDQIILCSIYSICKVNKTEPEVTFRRIIEIYKQLHINVNRLQVIKDIPLDPRSGNPSNQKGDVIKFYNKIYIGKMKTFVLQFQQKQEQDEAMHSIQTPADAAERARAVQQRQHRPPLPNFPDDLTLPLPSPSSAELPGISPGFLNGFPGLGTGPPQLSTMPMLLSSPQRVNQTNVYLSRTPDNLRRQNTPGHRALYAFGESPAIDLDLINRAVNRQPDLPLMDEFVAEDEGPSETPTKKLREQEMYSL